MKAGKKVITRRDFIRVGSCFTMGSLMGLPLVRSVQAKSSDKSRVVLVRDGNVIDSGGNLSPGVLEDMLDKAVTALMHTADPVSAWAQLVKPSDVVGIKTNAWYHLPTPEQLEAAIWMRLLDAGVKKGNVSADDRGVLGNPVFQRATALINVRPMRTHHWSGLGTLLKNYIMFVPSPWKYHGNACERLGAIWQLPHVAGKTRLNILVMLTPLFHGIGPHHFSRRYTWRYCGLIVSRDPVAADATGARIIQAKRNLFFGTEKPISPPPRHIPEANVRFGLGNSQPDQIQLIRLGWQKDLLI
ncbi:MAG: DUF362 domain-containing protein [Deltaproteobacteria bacterium]|nr:MAG: DUF362 domain-containing protein [Deltaproteobacteria bacterium]